MKKRLFTALSATICIMSCDEGVRTVERPIFNVSNTETIEVAKIEVTDSATVFHIDASYYPNQWIRISKDTYLSGGGKKYVAIRGEGIELDSTLSMPESGEASFKIVFPPIDRKLKTIDFIESDCEDCFKIYGIDLTGKAVYPESPAGLPDDAKHDGAKALAQLPEPPLEVGTTSVRAHLLGYREGMPKNVKLYVNTFFPSGQNDYESEIGEDGLARFEFEQYGMNSALLYYNGAGYDVIVTPGDDLDVYVDLSAVSRNASKYHKPDEPLPALYFKGGSAALNYAISQHDLDGYSYQTRSMDFIKAIEGMDLDQYLNHVMDGYQNAIAKIENASELSAAEKEYATINAKGSALSAFLSCATNMEYAYRSKNNLWNEPNIDFKKPEMTDEQYGLLKPLGLNTTKMLYSRNFVFNYTGIFAPASDKKKSEGCKMHPVTNDTEGFLFDLMKLYGIPEKIAKMEPLDDTDKSNLASIKNPFYAKACDALQQKLDKELEAAKGKTGYTICEVPNVANDKLFEAIIEPYKSKGKVVLVDFWATWCGPCRAAIKWMEPLKEAELKSDGLAFVYITGETSPMTKWLTMIGDIKGFHYRLTDEQWGYVLKKFDIDGIPSYVLVEKDGSYKLSNELRDHDLMKKTLLERIK